MSAQASPLPPVQRVVTWTSPAGKIEVIDDTIPIEDFVYGLQVATLFVQPDPVSHPTKGAEYAHGKVDGFIPTSGDRVFAFDLPPQNVGVAHFTQSLDYMVVVKGDIQVETTEGQRYDVKQGGITINLGNVHRFINPTDEWSRLTAGLICIISAAQPYKSQDGKGLKELYPDALAG